MRRLVVLFILFFLLFSAFILPAFGQSKRPFTFEDMMKLKRVGEPVPSPDGKWVLFSAIDVDLAANTKTPHIWIVPLNSGATGVSPVQAHVGADASSAHAERSSAASSGEHILIPDQDGDRPRWAPDGKRFAFISTKEGGSQVWIADFDAGTGTVTQKYEFTNIATEASGELWSPDGTNILFTSDVYPECDGKPADELACIKKKHKEAEDSKVKAIIFDGLLYRHWNAYKRGTRTHIFVMSTDWLGSIHMQNASTISVEIYSGPPRSIPRDLTPGDYDAPVFSLGGQDDYAFSPDGQELCYTSNHDKVEAISTNNDLWTVPVNWPGNATPADVLAKTKNITADNPASDSTPLYSPDGKYIAYRAQQRPGYEADRFRLMLYDRKTGEKKSLAKDFDSWVGSYVWEPNSQRIDFSAEHEGSSPIYSISLSGELQGVARGFYDDLTVTPDGKQLLFSRMSVQAPTGIFRVGLGEPMVMDCLVSPGKYPLQSCFGESEPLTHLNDAVLSQVSMPPLEPFWFTGAYGEKVQGFLVKPPNFDPNKKYPVKFIVHGGPEVPMGDEWSYRWNDELFAAPTPSQNSGYVVIEINFHGSPGYGQKFVDSINGNWGGAPFEDLMKGLDYAEKTYPFIDKDRECALGASYGGYMANWILGHTDRFKCIVSHDGMFNTVSAWGTTEELWFNNWEFQGTPYTNPESYEKWSPRNSAKNFKTPTLVIHGQLDYRLDLSEGLQLFTTLQTMGVPSKMLYFPDEGHWVLKPQNSQLWWKTVTDWVDQWTKK
jgi:dipeptidyl aminopeptidase/acylaminoacyl peptidase